MTRIGKVIDIDDPKKLGRVKVEILPELQSLPESLLPWACPEQEFNASEGFDADIPSKGSFILVDIDDTWTVFSYDGTRPFSDDTTGSQSAYDLLSKYKSGLKPTALHYGKASKYEYALFETDNEIGIVFGDNIYVTWDGSGFLLKRGDKVSIAIDANGVNINDGNLVIAPKAGS